LAGPVPFPVRRMNATLNFLVLLAAFVWLFVAAIVGFGAG
jgi:hypothetical protein